MCLLSIYRMIGLSLWSMTEGGRNKDKQDKRNPCQRQFVHNKTRADYAGDELGVLDERSATDRCAVVRPAATSPVLFSYKWRRTISGWTMVIYLTFMEPCLAKVFLSTTNEMQRYTMFFIVVSALHVSSGFSTHHQELKNRSKHGQHWQQ
jgi:hypothetical protein